MILHASLSAALINRTGARAPDLNHFMSKTCKLLSCVSVNIALVHRAPVGSVAAYLAGTAGFKHSKCARKNFSLL